MNGSKAQRGGIRLRNQPAFRQFHTSAHVARLWLQLHLYKGVQSETMQIERHSEPIGLFVPIATKDQRTRREVIDRLGRLVDDLVCHSGIDEDELVREISSSNSHSPSQN